MKSYLYFLGLALLIALSSISYANDQNWVSQLQLSDQLYKDFLIMEEPDLIEDAVDILDRLIADYPDEWEIYWKAARCYNEYAIFADDPIIIFEQGIRFAQKSLELQEHNPEAHFWLAAIYGQLCQRKGVLNSLTLVKKMKDELEHCLQIEPEYDYAYHVLAKLYLVTPGWPISIGDKEKALNNELKAVELKPNYIPYRWGLYNIYRELGKKKEALEVLEVIIKLPLEDEFENVYHEPLSDQQIKELAEKVLNH